jgi:CheY-like chemotaxis protein
MSILLIEDDAIHMKLIRRALEKSGYGDNIINLDDGEKAISYLFPQEKREKHSLPRLIIMDINLPKINGIEVLRRIKEDEKLRIIPVVMLTTSSNRMDMEKCFKYNANSYIVKPLDFQNFMDKMKNVAQYWLEVNTVPTE